MRQNFDPIWSEALVSNYLLCDYLGLTFQVVAYGRFNCIKVLLLHFFSEPEKKIISLTLLIVVQSINTDCASGAAHSSKINFSLLLAFTTSSLTDELSYGVNCIVLFQKPPITTNLQEFLVLHAHGCRFAFVLAHQTTFSTQPERDEKQFLLLNFRS